MLEKKRLTRHLGRLLRTRPTSRPGRYRPREALGVGWRRGRRPGARSAEIDLPGTDEIVWALGGRHPDGQPRLRCRAGIRIDRVAGQERRLLRDYVIETRRARRVESLALNFTKVSPR